MIDRRMLRQRGLPGLLVLAGVAAGWNAIDAAFVFDDVRGIVDRSEYLSLPLWQVVAGERRPLVTLTLAVNHRLGGLDPRGYHAFNLAVHLATALALFALVRRGVERLKPGVDAAPVAFAVALLWVVHPLGTAATTYAIQRSEAMAALSMVLVLLAVLQAARSPRPAGWALAAIVAATLGMLSKATVVVVPVLALLLDGLVASGSLREAWRRRWGLHLALAATCLLLIPTGVAAALFHAGPRAEAGVGLAVTTVSPLEYLRSQPGVVLHYVGQTLWPATLCIDPDWPVARSARAIAGPAIVIAAGLVATAVAIRCRHPLAFPAAAFFVLLAPTSSIMPVRDLAAEHRMYLPLAALIVLVVAAVRALLRATPTLPTGPVAAVLLASASVALAARTIDRNRDYATPVALWTATVAAAPHNHRARMNLGVALRAEGRDAEAVEELRAALAMQANDPIAQLNLGAALLDEGRIREAAAILEIVAPRLWDRPRAWTLLGDARRALGADDEGLAAYRRAHEASPDPAILLRIGNALAESGRLDEAAREFESAAATRDEQLRASALFNLGNTRFRQDDLDGAVAAYRDALLADPDHAGARHWLAEAQRRRTDP